MTRLAVALLCLTVLAAPLGAGAQPARAPKVGVLFLGTAGLDITAGGAPLRDGLRELGWVENQNVWFENRFANGNRDRLPSLAAELIRDKVDVIVANGSEATRAASRATTSLPIVMAGVGDPLRMGFVASLSRPSGNI